MTENGVTIILSNKPEEAEHTSRFRLPRLPDFLRIFRILSKILPYYITIFSFKCLLSVDNSNIYIYNKKDFISDPYEPDELYESDHYAILFYFTITYVLTILYHFSIIVVRFTNANSDKAPHVIWLDENFHRFVFIIGTLIIKMMPRFFLLSNTLIFFYESVKIFDSDLITRTKNLYIILHQYSQIVLRSQYYQRFRAFAEGLWFPYILFYSILSLDLNYILFLYFYFFFVLMYQIQCDEFHYWIWLQTDAFCTKLAFQITNQARPILLKILFTIRNLGAVGRKIYPPIDSTE